MKLYLRLHKQRAASLPEFATALLVLIPTIFGVIYGIMYWTIKGSVQDAANRALNAAIAVPNIDSADNDGLVQQIAFQTAMERISLASNTTSGLVKNIAVDIKFPEEEGYNAGSPILPGSSRRTLLTQFPVVAEVTAVVETGLPLFSGGMVSARSAGFVNVSSFLTSPVPGCMQTDSGTSVYSVQFSSCGCSMDSLGTCTGLAKPWGVGPDGVCSCKCPDYYNVNGDPLQVYTLQKITVTENDKSVNKRVCSCDPNGSGDLMNVGQFLPSDVNPSTGHPNSCTGSPICTISDSPQTANLLGGALAPNTVVNGMERKAERCCGCFCPPGRPPIVYNGQVYCGCPAIKQPGCVDGPGVQCPYVPDPACCAANNIPAQVNAGRPCGDESYPINSVTVATGCGCECPADKPEIVRVDPAYNSVIDYFRGACCATGQVYRYGRCVCDETTPCDHPKIRDQRDCSCINPISL